MNIQEALGPLRQNIDKIDNEIIGLLNERVRLAGEVGKIKMREGGSIYVPSREQLIFDKLSKLNKGPLTDSAIRSIWREIISASISLEKKLIIAYLGPEATFTHQAAIKNFGSSLDYRPMKTIQDVILEVERGEADYGVFPIENSTGGAVNHSQEILVDSDLKIISEVFLPVEHCLISDHPVDKITKVYSKDQALSQCRDWLNRHLPNAELIEVDSTAKGVLIAKDSENGAAIGSELAAQSHQVGVVAKSIQDRMDNSTRFLVIGDTPSPAIGNGRDRTSLVLSVRDEVSALQKVLEPFSKRGINLCKIESRPTRLKPWEYYFFIDLVGHFDEPVVQEAYKELEKCCLFIKWLGSYPCVTQK
ncbi:MAG: prephenate dehydratase [Opitutales bacterium]